MSKDPIHNKYVQDGTGPGEFGPDYSPRKKYQLGHGKEVLVNTHRNPRQPPYPSHVVDEYRAPNRHASEWINAPSEGRTVSPPPNGLEEGEQAEAYHNKSASDSESLYGPHWDKPIKRSRTKPLTKEELEYRHEKLKRFMDPDFGPDQLKDTQEN